MSATDRDDLTRWNRAGLARLRYVDANAVTMLETLRRAMRARFPGADGWTALDALPADAPPPRAGESVRERHRRGLARYHGERQDYGWEILRTYARALHVLLEHLDAYANETSLATATQWQSLRRLAAMLDYRPAPPASAETVLAILAKAGRSGPLAAGFAVKNKPEDGGAPVIFETLEGLDLDAALNSLRPADWHRSREPFVFDPAEMRFPLAAPVQGVAEGSVGLLLIDTDGFEAAGVAVHVDAVSDHELTLRADVAAAEVPHLPGSIRRHQVRLRLKPESVTAPRIHGDNAVVLDRSDHGLSEGAVIAWDGGGDGWQAARVLTVQRNRLLLDRPPPAAETPLYPATELAAADYTGVGAPTRRVILPATRAVSRVWTGALAPVPDSALATAPSDPDDDDSDPLYEYLNGWAYPRVYLVPDGDAAAVVDRPKPQTLEFDGKPGERGGGDWLVATLACGLRAARIEGIDAGDDGWSLTPSVTLTGASLIHDRFTPAIHPLDHDVNNEPAYATADAERSPSSCLLPLALDALPDALAVGRRVLVVGDGSAQAATVTALEPGRSAIRIAPPLPGSEPGGEDQGAYPRHATTIHANAVRTGHGETQKSRILGSGDATVSGQTFVLEATAVSCVTDSGFIAGVRPDLDVSVDGRTWTQVDDPAAATPTDHGYQALQREDGGLDIRFGDGVHGRRLPTGSNNVRCTFRKGNGLAGNLPAGSLVEALRKHPLVDGVRQPIAAGGGNDLEGTESLRENAPASVLTLGRAVSVQDFTHLAAAQSGVWQAHAFARRSAGRGQSVDVAVVPAGGGPLGTLGDSLTATLTAHALPGVKVRVLPYRALILDLVVGLRVDSAAYDPQQVAADVAAALLADFALAQRRLGAPLYRSEAIAAVEAVAGVATCTCRINPDGFRDADGRAAAPRQAAAGPDGHLRRVSPDKDQVLYVEPTLSQITVTTQEATP